jgi:hypothetical protein
MSLVRRLATKISNAVVEYASPGCKDWAEGLAREVAFIEGDWAALAWALGSTRVLLDRREAPVESRAALPAAAEKFAESKRSANATWKWMPVWCLLYIDRLFHATSWSQRIGCSLLLFGYIFLGIIVFLEWRGRLKVPASDDVLAVIQFYRAELERLRDLRSSKWWVTGPAFTLICVGAMMSEQAGVGAHPFEDAFLGLVWVGGVLLFLHAQRTNQRRLERLDELLSEQE